MSEKVYVRFSFEFEMNSRASLVRFENFFSWDEFGERLSKIKRIR
jgi:hypothetical protein